MDTRRFRPEAAEMAGTFALVLLGAGGPALLGRATGPLATWLGALLSGLVIGIGVHFLGRVSGAHFNPAVTFGLVSVGEFPSKRAVPFVVAQLLGALFGALLLFGLTGSEGIRATTLPAADLPLPLALAAEAAATFLLMFVIMAAATDGRAPRWIPGPAIGATVMVGVLLVGPFTGGSMNPARTIGPALIFGFDASIVVYIAGPAAGSLVAAFVYRLVRGSAPHRAGALGEVKQN